MSKKIAKVILAFFAGCFYGLFIGIFVYLGFYWVLHALDRKDFEWLIIYVGAACVPIYGFFKAWSVWDHLRLEEAHRQYTEYKEAQKNRPRYPPDIIG